MTAYVIEWVPAPRHAGAPNLNSHFSEIEAGSPKTAALRAQANHYGPYRVNRVFELSLDLSSDEEGR